MHGFAGRIEAMRHPWRDSQHLQSIAGEMQHSGTPVGRSCGPQIVQADEHLARNHAESNPSGHCMHMHARAARWPHLRLIDPLHRQW